MKFQQQAFARNPRTPMLGELRFQDSRGGEKRDGYMNAIALIYKKLETEPPSHRHMVLEQW